MNGLSQMKALQPYLQARLRKTVQEKMDPQIAIGGSNNPPKTVSNTTDRSRRLDFDSNSPHNARLRYRHVGSLFFWRKAMYENNPAYDRVELTSIKARNRSSHMQCLASTTIR